MPSTENKVDYFLHKYFKGDMDGSIDITEGIYSREHPLYHVMFHIRALYNTDQNNAVDLFLCVNYVNTHVMLIVLQSRCDIASQILYIWECLCWK